jgi:hypothetical protein
MNVSSRYLRSWAIFWCVVIVLIPTKAFPANRLRVTDIIGTCNTQTANHSFNPQVFEVRRPKPRENSFRILRVVRKGDPAPLQFVRQ